MCCVPLLGNGNKSEVHNVPAGQHLGCTSWRWICHPAQHTQPTSTPHYGDEEVAWRASALPRISALGSCHHGLIGRPCPSPRPHAHASTPEAQARRPYQAFSWGVCCEVLHAESWNDGLWLPPSHHPQGLHARWLPTMLACAILGNGAAMALGSPNAPCCCAALSRAAFMVINHTAS